SSGWPTDAPVASSAANAASAKDAHAACFACSTALDSVWISAWSSLRWISVVRVVPERPVVRESCVSVQRGRIYRQSFPSLPRCPVVFFWPNHYSLEVDRAAPFQAEELA